MKNREEVLRFSEEEIRRWLPLRKKDGHKGSFGKGLFICGSVGMAGAAYLAAKAAYLSGIGLVKIYTPEENRIILQTLLPQGVVHTYQTFQKEELKALLNWADVIGIGCGCGITKTSRDILGFVLKQGKKNCVVDADALTILSKELDWLENGKDREWILTPHVGEMSRLLDEEIEEWLSEKEARLRTFVESYPVTCVLKDGSPIIGTRGKPLVQSQTGNQGMAKAGSGDILTGILVALLAQNMKGYEASILGTYLHGKSGDKAKKERGSYSILIEDLLESLAKVWKEEEEGYENL